MRLYENGILSKAAIFDYLRISSRTFDRILSLWNATGEVVRERNGVRGCPRSLHFSDVEYLNRLIRHRPDWFLDEVKYLLQTNRFISARFTTVHRELVRAGISEKNIKNVASERNENLRANFIARMAQYSPEQLGFLDEVSKDEHTAFRTRAVRKGVFVRGRRFSAVGLLSMEWME